MEYLSPFWCDRWADKDRRTVCEWARDNVILSSPLTKTGPFDVSTSRHLEAPLIAYQDDYVREVNILMGTRGGKTLDADVLSMWIPACNPGSILWVFQDDDAAKDQAELRTWKMIEKCEAVRSLLSSDRHASRTCEINFPHMPFHICGPAASNLQSRGWQNVWLDEPWQYKKGKIEEARARLGDYVKMGTDKLLCLSQGGEDGGDWSTHYNRGWIHTWHVECAKCGHFQYPTWSGLRPDGSRWGMMFDSHKDAHGLWIPARAIPTVRFECEKCAHPHTWSVRTKTEWNRTGKYIAENNPDKSKTKKSFTAPSTIDYPWDQLCELYLQAMNECKLGNPLPLIQFFQKRMAQFSSEKTVMEGSLNLARAVYEIDSEWEAEDVRLISVDVQEQHLWVQCRAFSGGRDDTIKGESRRLYFGKLFSFSEVEALREKFKVQPNRVVIDSGYRTKEVYAACVRYGWTALKGVDNERDFFHDLDDGRVRKSYSEPQQVDPETGTEFQGRRFANLITFAANIIADRLDGLISKGIWKEPQNVEDEVLEKEYRRQMSAEYKKKMVNKRTSEVTYIRVCPSHNNHAYDLGKMLLLGAILTDVIPDPYDERTNKKQD